jgi:hypothetical protein
MVVLRMAIAIISKLSDDAVVGYTPQVKFYTLIPNTN